MRDTVVVGQEETTSTALPSRVLLYGDPYTAGDRESPSHPVLEQMKTEIN